MKWRENRQKLTFQGDFSEPALKITVFFDMDLLKYTIENTKSKSEHSDFVGGSRKLNLKVPIFNNVTDFGEDLYVPPSNLGKKFFFRSWESLCIFMISWHKLVILPHFLINGLLKSPKSQKIDEIRLFLVLRSLSITFLKYLEGIFLFQAVGKFHYHGRKVCLMINIILGS